MKVRVSRRVKVEGDVPSRSEYSGGETPVQVVRGTPRLL